MVVTAGLFVLGNSLLSSRTTCGRAFLGAYAGLQRNIQGLLDVLHCS
jgi:hypothetical protein